MPLPNEKGIILTTSSLTVRNLVFTGAQISNDIGGNGAAIRDQNPDNTPASLVVDNSVFYNNQEAILQCCDTDETVTIINSKFKNNGNPDPGFFQHGIYIGPAASLAVVNSVFCGQLVGHDIKSRAAQTIVVASLIYNGAAAPAAPPLLNCNVGNGSFNIEVANGGVAVISGNTLVQGLSAQQNQIVSYGAEGMNYADNSLTVTKNSFVGPAGSVGVSDPPCVPVQLGGLNTFTGLGTVVNPAHCIAPAQPGQ